MKQKTNRIFHRIDHLEVIKKLSQQTQQIIFFAIHNLQFSIWIFILFFSFYLLDGGSVFSQEEIMIEPSVIERKTQPRDFLELSVTINNQSNSTVRLYPLIKDISGPRQDEKIEKINSLASWIEISRGRIEIPPGVSKEIPFSVRVHFNALPGKYYTTISFVEGSTFPQAQENASKYQQPTLLLNIDVQENIIEKAEIKRFQTTKNIFLKFPIEFILEIKNIGNREIIPLGLIHIYDKKGKEIAAIDLPSKTISAGESNTLNIFWQGEKGFGRYKAFLFAEYGKSSGGTLQDTVYFWILSWKFLILFTLGILVLLYLLIIFIIRKPKKQFQVSSPKKTLDLRKRI